MPRLIIDGLPIEVEPGTKVIRAAEMLGIMIPRFCYHEALGSVGACRLCAVKFVEGKVKGIQMSCMVDADEGMVVSTTDPEAVDFRAHVIEWLMANHPHDCPVCDEGGHCLLQDMTVSGGHGVRRYPGRKRTYRDQDLGVFVQHEMNRCIHCYRCRRFYQEFAGYRDLGAMQLGSRTYFGRVQDGPLESPFAGNLIDICPTGVFTDKPARFQGRRWDFQRTPSICVHCSLGCANVASARYREVVRTEARFDAEVNGYFICDRGRFGFRYANLAERPRQARVGDREVPLTEALAEARRGLREIDDRSGPGAVAALASPRASLESLALLGQLCALRGWRAPVGFLDPGRQRRATAAISRLEPGLAVSLRRIERADCVLAAGTDPLNEAPMLALAMRQAHRRGAPVILLDPRPVTLPFPFEQVPVPREQLALFLHALAREAAGREAAASLGPAAVHFFEAEPPANRLDPALRDRLPGLAAALKKSGNPVVVCGTAAGADSLPHAAADLALLLKAEKGRAGLFNVLGGPNDYGAALLASPERDLERLLAEIEAGEVRALVVVEGDPLVHGADPGRLARALGRLELLVVLDYLPSRTARAAGVLLPAATVFESQACYLNQEGRPRWTTAVQRGGTPIAIAGAGDHPPRAFRADIPGGEFRPAWRLLAEIGRDLPLPGPESSPQELWKWLAGRYPFLAGVSPPASDRADGERVFPTRPPTAPFSVGTDSAGFAARGGGEFDLLVVEWTLGTEELSGYSACIREAEPPPVLYLHGEDGAGLGLADGEAVALALPGGTVEARLRLRSDMARGTLVLPRHRQFSWHLLEALPARVRADSLGRARPAQPATAGGG